MQIIMMYFKSGQCTRILHLSDQRAAMALASLRICANTQTHKSHRCSHTQSIDIDIDSDKHLYL